MNHKNRLLIIFYRNPVFGKVKTRLAVTLGDATALAVYLRMVQHTLECTLPAAAEKIVYYSDFVDREDRWPNEQFQKALQEGGDLGEKMMNAFRKGFENGYTSICIVGTDCLELTPEILDQAFYQLRTHEAVIGPANDGGYYLLGMNKLFTEVFENKKWSSDTVCFDTVADFRNLGIEVEQLPLLSDVDEEKDLPADWRKLFKRL